LPFGPVGVRRVPGRGAESRQPDGNAKWNESYEEAACRLGMFGRANRATGESALRWGTGGAGEGKADCLFRARAPSHRVRVLPLTRR
jgi:hypothetical protein